MFGDKLKPSAGDLAAAAMGLACAGELWSGGQRAAVLIEEGGAYYNRVQNHRLRHCEEAKPTKQSRVHGRNSGLLRCARNDGHDSAGW